MMSQGSQVTPIWTVVQNFNKNDISYELFLKYLKHFLTQIFEAIGPKSNENG
jgi:hypothetical protein